MPPPQLEIGFVRRGYSSSGGAESYLKRLADGVVKAGHRVHLFATSDWPANEWPGGEITRLDGRTPIAFANALRATKAGCEVVMSLERVWSCDLFRAGDGVHRAWLERRAAASPARKLLANFNANHRRALELERSLFSGGGARSMIANSRMVKDEIIRLYGVAPEKIELVYNGVPVAEFRGSPQVRARVRADLQLADDSIAVLFAGSGWERKGLRAAVEAVKRGADPRLHLLVAGNGNPAAFRSASARFLGPIADMPGLYAAADIFILPTLYDPFSNACLEALAAGLPVVTTRANGFAEIIEHDVHGSIIEEPGDVAALAEAVRGWSDPRRRIEAREKILHRASQFDISANVERTLAILSQVAASAAST